MTQAARSINRRVARLLQERSRQLRWRIKHTGEEKLAMAAFIMLLTEPSDA